MRQLRLLWRIGLWLLVALSVANAIQVMRDPAAVDFFAFWIAVALAVVSVGTIVAVGIASVRKFKDSPTDSSHRLS